MICQIGLTYRPSNHENQLMAKINQVARHVQGAPYDHTFIRIGSTVYESVFPDGVRKISWNDWQEGRESSVVWLYDLPEHLLDMRVFDKLEGRKYDIRANIGWFLRMRWLLTYKPENGIYCSELIAMMLHKADPELWTPRDVAEYVSKINKGINKQTIIK